RTQLLSNVGCNVFCGCPEDKDDWFTLTSVVGGSGSSCPNGCIVSYTLNIPDEYDCYTLYRIDDGNSLSSYHPMNGNQLNGIPACIPKDDPLTITLYLYRYLGDQNPCIITKTTGCDIDCCDYIDVSFIYAGLDGNGPNCKFTPIVKSRDNGLCNIDSDIEVRFYKYYNDSWHWEPNPYYAFDISIDPTSIDPSPTAGKLAIGYEIYFNGILCRTMELIEVECGCTCAPKSMRQSWLKVETDPDDPACSPSQCKVRAELDISGAKDNDCYTEYTLDYNIYNEDGSTKQSEISNGTKIPISTNGVIDPTSLPCLEPGESIEIRIKLYKTGSNQPCEIVSFADHCPLINLENETVCDLQNEIPQSGGSDVVHVDIDGCIYEVSYKFYLTTDGYQNIELTSMTPLDPNCDGVNTHSKVYQQSLAKAISDILLKEPGYEPKGNTVCYDFWRVVHKSCWSKWEVISSSNVEEILYIPCEAECCGRKLRVCKYTEPARVVVEDLGFAFGSSNYNCSQSAVVPDAPEWPQVTINGTPLICFDLDCDVFKDIKIVEYADKHDKFDDKILTGPPLKRVNEIDSKYEFLVYNVFVE
ncbi:MAG: hypothetical protein RIF34_07590, partial [Candidatus Kapaibacterium sp.]